MKPTIVEVSSKKQLSAFIHFPEKLYENAPNWVPALIGDEFDTLDPKKNAAFEFCDAQLFLAYNTDNQIVGRVAAIINHKADEMWGGHTVRFGWIDFINDIDVARALIDSVEEWGKARGCETIKGPLGFTDMDKEGLLVEGYEYLSPFTCIYNYPYYGELLEQLGLEKDADWTQKEVVISEEMPPMYQYADLISKKFGLSIYHAKSVNEMYKKYGMKLFHLYNETFAPLFEFTPLTDKQIERYLQTYKAILGKDFIAILQDAEGEMAGFAFCVPSLSKAVKKCKGRLFPFGWIPLLRALKHNDTLEALMIGILPEHQGKGANVLLFKYLHENCLKYGIHKMIMNPQLETNAKVQNLFDQFETKQIMRRRCYKKSL